MPGEDLRLRIDLDSYLRARVPILNAHGGRGHAQGVRTFDCPLCGDGRGRGWMNVLRWSAGCFNSGCVAEPAHAVSALEWVRRHEDFPTRGRTWAFLLADYPGAPPLPPTIEAHEDFCRFPPSQPLTAASVLGREALAFVRKQWGLPPAAAARWGLRVCGEGDFAYRVLIPIREAARDISFLGRAFRVSVLKYRVAEFGIETGRRLGDLLFNLDAALAGSPLVLVEGAGDVMAWGERVQSQGLPAVALLGQALTPERLALLAQRTPALVIVALDQEPPAQRRALAHLEDLRAWGLSAALGTWTGGKDAGSGAHLTWTRDDSLESRMRARLSL